MKEKRPVLYALIAAGVVLLIAAWVGMRSASEEPGGASSAAASPDGLRRAPAVRQFDPRRGLALRQAARERGRLKAPRAPLPASPDVAGLSYDAYLLKALGSLATRDGPREDVLGQGGPRVDLGAEGDRLTEGLVDLDRDGRWDERWRVADGAVRREVSPADDEQYPRKLVFVAGVWTVADQAPAAP